MNEQKFLLGVVPEADPKTEELRQKAMLQLHCKSSSFGVESYDFIMNAIKSYEPQPEFTYEECCTKTYTGKYINVFKPRAEDICIEDIAHGLSIACRFGNQLPEFFSVAQHSEIMSRRVWSSHAKAALLHDASEAYMHDMPSPIKKGLPDYKKVETGLMIAIARKFGFEYPLHIDVKTADREMFLMEMHCLSRKKERFPYPVHGSIYAERMFLNRWEEVK